MSDALQSKLVGAPVAHLTVDVTAHEGETSSCRRVFVSQMGIVRVGCGQHWLFSMVLEKSCAVGCVKERNVSCLLVPLFLHHVVCDGEPIHERLELCA